MKAPYQQTIASTQYCTRTVVNFQNKLRFFTLKLKTWKNCNLKKSKNGSRTDNSTLLFIPSTKNRNHNWDCPFKQQVYLKAFFKIIFANILPQFYKHFNTSLQSFFDQIVNLSFFKSRKFLAFRGNNC